MGIYRVNIEGRNKPVLVKAASASKAKDSVVTAESLKAEEMADALANGETVWKPGDPFPSCEKYETFTAGGPIARGEYVELRDGKMFAAREAGPSPDEAKS